MSPPSPNSADQTLTKLAGRYHAALRTFLDKRSAASYSDARKLGCDALAHGVGSAALANMHREALVAIYPSTAPPPAKDGWQIRSSSFRAAVVVAHGCARDARIQAKAAVRSRDALQRRHLAALERETSRRKNGAAALRKGSERYHALLVDSRVTHRKLRQLTRQILLVQETERKEISRELHDEVVQTLIGINVELSALGKTSSLGASALRNTIARSQRLVASSVNVVHRFARKLRPPVLDDMGLISAIHAYSKEICANSRLQIKINAVREADTLDSVRRTVLYRVAQEALNNVLRHSKATKVTLNISRTDGWICLDVVDNGVSFPVDQTLRQAKNHRLGLIGMRERLEMIRGSLTIDSTPGIGTTIHAKVPLPGKRLHS